jgi:hypothetical protein
MVHKWLLGHFAPSSPTWASNFSCYLFYSWFLPVKIKQAKGNECSQYKSTAAIFSSSFPGLFSPSVSIYNILLGMLCEVTSANLDVLTWGYECKTCLGVTWENIDEANGQTGGKNRSTTFVLTAFISFSLFNVFRFCLTQIRISAKLAKPDQNPEFTAQTQGSGHQDCENKFAVKKLYYKTLG